MADLALDGSGATDDPQARRPTPPFGLAMRALLFCAAYYFGTLLGYALIFPSSYISVLWPPNKNVAVESLRGVAAIVDAKAPADAASFKTLLRDISKLVADASTEGGFLGFGGVRVSDAEKATLAEISSALRLPA